MFVFMVISMFRSKKGQAAMEVLIIFGVMIIGVVVFGAFYLQNVGTKISSPAGTPGDKDPTTLIQTKYDKTIINDGIINQTSMTGGSSFVNKITGEITGCNNNGICQTHIGENSLNCSDCCSASGCSNGQCNICCPDNCVLIDSCENGELDVDEEDIDCGGVCPNSCIIPPNCNENEICEPHLGETALNCPTDCGIGYLTCGNGTCDAGETHSTCPQDCRCGDEFCGYGENTTNCSTDCYCGNNRCDTGENRLNCSKDCYEYLFFKIISPISDNDNYYFSFVGENTPVFFYAKLLRNKNGSIIELTKDEKKEINEAGFTVNWFVDNGLELATNNYFWGEIPKTTTLLAQSNLNISYQDEISIKTSESEENKILSGDPNSEIISFIKKEEDPITTETIAKFNNIVELGHNIDYLIGCSWYFVNLDNYKIQHIYNDYRCGLSERNQLSYYGFEDGQSYLVYVQAKAMSKDVVYCPPPSVYDQAVPNCWVTVPAHQIIDTRMQMITIESNK